MQKQPESIYFIKHSEFKKVVDYIMSVPTGTLPGSRLAETLNILDNLTAVPAHAVPVLEQALRQMTQKPEMPSTTSDSLDPDKKPSNGAEASTAE